MSEPNRSPVNLERPRMTVRYVADLRGDRVRETKLVCSDQAVRNSTELMTNQG